jgi:hypothetical protein
MAIGISSEETFLRPLIGSIQNFEIIAIILSIIMLHGFGIYAFSFIGVYLILMSTNLVYITIGLFFLIISIGLVAHSKR